MRARGRFFPIVGTGAAIALIAGVVFPADGVAQPGDDDHTPRKVRAIEHPDGSGTMPSGGGVMNPRLKSQSLTAGMPRLTPRARYGARKALMQSPLVAGKGPNRRMPAEPYVPQSSCYPYGLPGVVAFRDMLLEAYPRQPESLHTYNIGRGCNTPGISEHEEGRALDFEADIRNPKQHAQAVRLLKWLTKNRGYQARRWGILYIIHNQRIWGQYNPRWRGMANRGNWTDNHKDHVHFTFTWNGALQQTPYWTGKVRRTNFGPCPRYAGSFGPLNVQTLTSRPRTWRCGRGKRIPSRWKYTGPIMYWQAGDRVKWLQEFMYEEGTFAGEVSSSFGQQTYESLVAWQRQHGVTPTGVWDPESQNKSGRVVGKRSGTTLTGWDPAPATVSTGQLVPFAVTVASDRLTERRVRVQRRSTLPGSKWETLAEQHVPETGVVNGTLAGQEGSWQYRLVVLESSWAERAEAQPKTLTVALPTPTPTPASTSPTPTQTQAPPPSESPAPTSSGPPTGSATPTGSGSAPEQPPMP